MSRLERIVAACGGVLLDGGARALIPGPGHSRNDRSVSLVETEEGRIIIHCFSPKDDWRAVRSLLLERGLLDETPLANAANKGPEARAPIVQPQDEDRLARAKRIWDESRAMCSTPASAYLERRAIGVGAGNPALRFHPRMTSIDDTLRRPALVAAILDRTGELQGVQATLVTRYGAGKAQVATPRRIIGKLVGGAVRLDAPTDTLLVAEGVESALSAGRLVGAPAWAALSAHNLSLFEPPSGVTRLIIAADNDAAGRAAVETLSQRLLGRIELIVRLPEEPFNDWNDVAAATRRPMP